MINDNFNYFYQICLVKFIWQLGKIVNGSSIHFYQIYYFIKFLSKFYQIW